MLFQIEREMAEKGKQINSKRSEPATNLRAVLRCHKCDSFAADSADIRTIENSHHVIVDKQ
jgi:hypothetical protein